MIVPPRDLQEKETKSPYVSYFNESIDNRSMPNAQYLNDIIDTLNNLGGLHCGVELAEFSLGSIGASLSQSPKMPKDDEWCLFQKGSQDQQDYKYTVSTWGVTNLERYHGRLMGDGNWMNPGLYGSTTYLREIRGQYDWYNYGERKLYSWVNIQESDILIGASSIDHPYPRIKSPMKCWAPPALGEYGYHVASYEQMYYDRLAGLWENDIQGGGYNYNEFPRIYGKNPPTTGGRLPNGKKYSSYIGGDTYSAVLGCSRGASLGISGQYGFNFGHIFGGLPSGCKITSGRLLVSYDDCFIMKTTVKSGAKYGDTLGLISAMNASVEYVDFSNEFYLLSAECPSDMKSGITLTMLGRLSLEDTNLSATDPYTKKKHVVISGTDAFQRAFDARESKTIMGYIILPACTLNVTQYTHDENFVGVLESYLPSFDEAPEFKVYDGGWNTGGAMQNRLTWDTNGNLVQGANFLRNLSLYLNKMTVSTVKTCWSNLDVRDAWVQYTYPEEVLSEASIPKESEKGLEDQNNPTSILMPNFPPMFEIKSNISQEIMMNINIP